MGTSIRYALKSWVDAEVQWRWRAIILTVTAPQTSDAVWSALANARAGLDLEADDLSTALAELANGTTTRGKIAAGIRDMIAGAMADLAAMPAEAISPKARTVTTTTGAGGLRGMKGLGAGEADVVLTEWQRTVAFGERCLRWLFGIGTATILIPPAYRALRDIGRSQIDIAHENTATANAIENDRQTALAHCSSDPDPSACASRINDTYDALLPSKCDILDTPLGSGIGTLVGIGFGYVGMRKIMGWA